MKKTYIMPLVEVVKTEAEELICISQEFLIDSEKGFDGTDLEILEKNDFENVFENLW